MLTAPTTSEHVKVEFEDKTARYVVTIYHAPQYHILRHWLCGDDLNFARSLHFTTPISTEGGKTRASFFASHDRRFLLKAIKGKELKHMQTQADPLFWYADQVLFEKLPSVLVQVVGLFKVEVHQPNRRTRTKTFTVQRNLRFKLQASERSHLCFDLKGIGKVRKVDLAMHHHANEDADEGPTVDVTLEGSASRLVADTPQDSPEQATSDVAFSPCTAGSPAGLPSAKQLPQPAIGASREPATAGRVLWDQNLREWLQGKPLGLPASDLQYLEAAVWNDTLLLAEQALIDYSMLLAVAPWGPEDGPNTAAGTVYMGIIDWLRPYDIMGFVENRYKNLTRGHGQGAVVDPLSYARRFQSAMSTFFVARDEA